MTDQLHPAALHRLRTALGPNSRILPFAAAVVQHLGRPSRSTADFDKVIDRVLLALRTAFDRTVNRSPDPLLGDPELLASFFQNADLLDRHDSESVLITRFVMQALEAAWQEPR